MGWELRHGGRRYLYRNRRIDGKPVKEYLAAGDEFGALMADDLRRLQARQQKVGRLTREARAEFRRRIDEMLAGVSEANATLRIVAAGILTALGFHQHHRGEWRMRRELSSLKYTIEQLRAALETRAAPLLKYEAPADDAAAVEVFAKARAGDPEALAKLQIVIRDRNWVGWLGDLGRQATRQSIVKAAGGDVVWEEGIILKANTLRDQLLGQNPTVLEELLVRRVVNGWVAVHALELELTVRPPANPRDRAYLDAALTRAQKRMTGAVGELARVRRLQAPKILAQLNVAAAQTVVNAVGVSQPASDPSAVPALVSGPTPG
jgi:hypothetical protein